MVTIRHIEERDISGFQSLLDKVCRERRFLATFEGPSIERVRSFVATILSEGHSQFVAECDGEIVGWCDVIPGEKGTGTTHVGRLGMGLAEPFRGRGIGRQLMHATLEKAAAIGLEKVELTVYASNVRAHALYRSCGFTEEGRKIRGRLVDGVYDDMILMALMLCEPTTQINP